MTVPKEIGASVHPDDLDISITHLTAMFSFKLLATPPQAVTTCARLGQLITRSGKIHTPNFIAPSSRGVVPHLSQDNLRDHTKIPGVYVAIEDFIEKPLPSIFDQPESGQHFNNTSSPANIPAGRLRAFTSHPIRSFQLLAPRRCPPVPAPATNTDHSIGILTSVGFRTLEVNDYHKMISHLSPDAAVGIVDIPSHAPGKARREKMVERMENWFGALLRMRNNSDVSDAGRTPVPILAPVLPVDAEIQRLYFDFLEEHQEQLAGLAVYDDQVAVDLPEGLQSMLRVLLRDCGTPQKVLEAVGRGTDLFTAVFPNEATDAGIALDFCFPTNTSKTGQEESAHTEVTGGAVRKQLGYNFWDNERYQTDLRPLAEGCDCYACKKHHRAFVAHLLNAKEMTAWVLLQIHNMHVVERFFEGVRGSIEKGTFEQDCEVFKRVYEDEMPKKTGEGPRLRGYQFKTTAGPRKNAKVFGKFTRPGGDRKERLEEADLPPDMDAVEMEDVGFAEKKI
ncbi:tRNA-guanine transglycosylase family protein [Pyronema omphalodes]|nr:tRNA-guanine transglycosylase family protein [Pyronema omphalodes]